MNLNISLRTLALAGGCVFATAVTPQIASAGTLTYTFTEVSGGVAVAVSGSLNSDLWSASSGQGVPPELYIRSAPDLYFGGLFSYVDPSSTAQNVFRDLYSPGAGVVITGPTSFGTNITGGIYNLLPGSASGVTVAGFEVGTSSNTFNYVFAPARADITDAAQLGANFTIFGETFVGMQLTPGSNSWVFTGTNGSGTVIQDTITLNIGGGGSSVPDAGPGPALALLLGSLGFRQWRASRRTRAAA
jgi:hypothetical protein